MERHRESHVNPARAREPDSTRSLLRALSGALGGVLLLTAAPSGAEAQYFGRNKVQYNDFDFEVLESEHFDVYRYEQEEAASRMAAQMSERWYARLSRLLDHELEGRQPLILYANHTHFQQTTAIPGQIGEGTGGVTEPLKRRIVLPLAGPLADTDHVLGHELVHGFQYDMTGIDPRSPLFGTPAISNLPLFMVEGMAEYLSVGPRSRLTAMWIRAGLASDDSLPSVRDLANARRWFPYRWGHAFWAYVAGRWGEDAVREVFRATARSGSSVAALEGVLDVRVDTLTRDWRAALRERYGPELEARGRASDVAEPVFPDEEAEGRVDVAPALSPDGERVVFLSERSRFAIDMYVADVETGEVLRQITESAVDPHFQSLQFINSAGAWAPDGRRFAFAAVSRGEPVLSVADTETGDRVREIRLPELGEVFNPTWSPDGERLAFVANEGGTMDLFTVEVASGEVRRLTDDPWAELHPDWSPSGDRIAFATDRFGGDLETLRFGDYRLATVDPSTGEVRRLPALEGAKHVNPRWGPRGERLYFVSDPDGVANVHVLEVSSGRIRRLTNVLGGVSGITELSPSLAVASASGRIVFDAFQDGGYRLYRLDPAQIEGDEPAVGEATTGLLPPVPRRDETTASLLADADLGLPDPITFTTRDYHAGLGLDYISQPSFGLGIGSAGSFVGAGATLHFSDMLGYYGLTTSLQLAIRDGNLLNGIGAVGQYTSRAGRVNWGLVGGQTPEITRSFRQGTDDVDGDGTPELVRETLRFWKINRRAMGVVSYPFSSVHRLEFTGGFERIDFELDAQREAFDPSGRRVQERTVNAPTCGDTLSFRQDFCEPPALNEASASAAFVYDNSVSGPTGPVMGRRMRVEVSPSVGTLDYMTGLADVRDYEMILEPMTLASRLLHFGRYGGDARDERLSRLFLGNSSLVRGYGGGSFDPGACPADEPLEACSELQVFDQLFGTRMLVGNVELRLPLIGPLGVLGTGAGFPPVDLIGFLDGGTAWTSDRDPAVFGGSRELVGSTGVGVRTNLLGFAVAEVHWVSPFDRPDKGSYVSFALKPAF